MNSSGKHQAGEQVNWHKQFPAKCLKTCAIIICKTSSSKIYEIEMSTYSLIL
jgi:hypothetical protein